MNERLENVNKLIEFISRRGRKFFQSNNVTASICISENGNYYFFDDYTQNLIYMWNNKAWNNQFTHGGTLKALLISFKVYIKTGNKPRGIVPYCFSNTNIWGYPEEDAKEIEAYAKELGIVVA